MKLHTKNKSELIEIRFCLVLTILFVTLLFAYGGRKSILLLNILFLPLLRIISLFSHLPKPTKIITKIIQSLLFLSAIFIYFYFEIMMSMFTSKNELVEKIFLSEMILLVIFHRPVFLSEYTFLPKYVYSIYKIFKRFYLDIMFIILGFKVLKSESIYDAFTTWTFDEFFIHNLWITIKNTFGFMPIYVIYITIAGIWYRFSNNWQKRSK